MASPKELFQDDFAKKSSCSCKEYGRRFTRHGSSARFVFERHHDIELMIVVNEEETKDNAPVNKEEKDRVWTSES